MANWSSQEMFGRIDYGGDDGVHGGCGNGAVKFPGGTTAKYPNVTLRTIVGTGTLDGPFAFAGEKNCLTVEGLGNRKNLATAEFPTPSGETFHNSAKTPLRPAGAI